tara:strand:+ start:189 stop:518 length:330 start_codon:yes stop_codon:yes gene_type:complete
MPTTPPVNTQQVLQMGTHTEKVQQTIQSLPNVTAQQLNKEREVSDELRRTQVQELSNTYFVEEIDPKTGAKKRVRVIKKIKDGQDLERSEPDKNIPYESYHGGSINIQA